MNIIYVILLRSGLIDIIIILCCQNTYNINIIRKLHQSDMVSD